jgi:hypothetical protein
VLGIGLVLFARRHTISHLMLTPRKPASESAA